MDEASGQLLDPFEFHGHPASCIAGLGGPASLPDPTYAFHTSYVPVARGHAHFTVRFTNLEARRGSLVLRVHMLPDGPGATAQMVTSHRIQLNWLAHHGGETYLRFEAFRGARYSLMGLVPDQLDASAEGLSITLDRPATEDDLAATGAGDAAEAQSTAYGSETIRSAPMALLLSLDPPSFAQPVSQPCTTRQMREPKLRARLKALGDVPMQQTERWQLAYAIEALERYGMLQAGARGLILGDAHPTLLRFLTAAGILCEHVTLAREGEEASSAIDPAALPGELFAFDFLLSIRSTDTLGSARQAASFIEQGMECLRPSGLAVHVVGYHPDPAFLASSVLPIAVFDRNGLERLAISLISRGHQMARMKPPLVQLGLEAGSDLTIPFGLISRRAEMIR
jgi:hypothetical protein